MSLIRKLLWSATRNHVEQYCLHPVDRFGDTVGFNGTEVYKVAATVLIRWTSTEQIRSGTTALCLVWLIVTILVLSVLYFTMERFIAGCYQERIYTIIGWKKIASD